MGSRSAWRVAGAALGALLLVTLLLYKDTVFYLTGIWNQLKTGEYAHGYLVVAISVYFVRDFTLGKPAFSAGGF